MRLIYLSPVFWRSYAQRPHFMVRHFLESGGQEVLWIDPYPGRLPKIGDLQRRQGIHDQGTEIDSRIKVVNFRSLPIEPLPGGFSFNKLCYGKQLFREIDSFLSRGSCAIGVGKPCHLALDIVHSQRFRYSFYDAMDDFPSFHKGLSRASMSRIEKSICHCVDDIFVSSTKLKRKFNDLSAHPTPILNAFNTETLPIVKKKKRKNLLVIGYIGSLGEWFDWDCLISLARVMPAGEIRIIGPQLSPLPAGLPANINIFPACKHEDIGPILQEFDIGIIPFLKTPLTQGVDPIKYYEYKAFGLPVLSTSFGEMALRKGEPGIFFLDGLEGIEVALQDALSFQSSPEELRKWCAENSWSARFASAGLFQKLFLPDHSEHAL